jgi:hypothetical protein
MPHPRPTPAADGPTTSPDAASGASSDSGGCSVSVSSRISNPPWLISLLLLLICRRRVGR